jgi:hypothetical protein
VEFDRDLFRVGKDGARTLDLRRDRPDYIERYQRCVNTSPVLKGAKDAKSISALRAVADSSDAAQKGLERVFGSPPDRRGRGLAVITDWCSAAGPHREPTQVEDVASGRRIS